MDITEVVNVQVSVEEAGVKGLDFGIPLVLGPTGFTNSDVVRSYDDMDAVAADFAITDPEYLAAEALFSQELQPDHILIGEQADENVAQVDTVTVVLANEHAYTVVINGVAFTYVSDASADAGEVTAGLIAAINAGAEPVTAGGASGLTFTLTADVAGTAFTAAEYDTNISIAHTTPNKTLQLPSAALTAILESGDLGKAWFALVLCSRVKADILDAAAWCETRTHAFIACSDDADVLTATAGNVAVSLKTLAYKHTTYFWSADEANFPEAALLGRVLPLVVGSWSLALQTLTGITADEFTSTQLANLKSQYCTYYPTIGGRGTTQGGWSANGNWFDAYVGAMWIEVNADTAIFNMKARRSPEKVPFTDAGIQLVVNELRGVLQQAETNGILAAEDEETPAFEITALPASSYTGVQKATRIMDGVSFVGNLAGAIHKTTILGKVVN